jgi:hypothetical protein
VTRHRANQSWVKIQETPEQAHKRREANLRNVTRHTANQSWVKIQETSEQAHKRREANLRNVTRCRANQTQAKIQEAINANSRIEEMVSIPQISEFVEVRDSKAKVFHHI